MEIDYGLTNIPKRDCFLVSMTWVDRGILLAIMNYLSKYHDNLRDRNIIIQDKIYRNFATQMFPELKITKFKKHSSDNFYFNIRKTIKEQDIFIDYLKKYDDGVPTKKIHLLPWYDRNDPLVVYEYDKKHKTCPFKYLKFLNNFSKCKRGNYSNNVFWDVVMENRILGKYNQVKTYADMNQVYKTLISYASIDYIPDKRYLEPMPKMEGPAINDFILIPSNKKEIEQYKNKIKNLEGQLDKMPKEEHTKFLLNLLNDKLNIINSIMENKK
jgi:hypothetical protein